MRFPFWRSDKHEKILLKFLFPFDDELFACRREFALSGVRHCSLFCSLFELMYVLTHLLRRYFYRERPQLVGAFCLDPINLQRQCFRRRNIARRLIIMSRKLEARMR